MKRFDVMSGGHYATERDYCDDGEFVDADDAVRLAEVLRAAMRFIDSHVSDPDQTSEMIKAYAELNALNPHELLASLEEPK